jgi:hypothetical protein
MGRNLSKYARYGVTAIWVIFGVALAGATAGEVRKAWYVIPTPPEITQDVTVRHVKDDEGRAASFRIMLFSDEFRWRINSFDAVEAEGGKRPQFTEEMKAVLNSASEIITVGASSEEIPSGHSLNTGRALEEHRAARRADQIATWVRSALSKPLPVRKLNAGYHMPTAVKAVDTSDQRRVVIILVLDHDNGTNVDEALRTAMKRESDRAPIFQTLLTQYSLASRPQFTWVQ